jgi:uncharacterized membrane protein YdjX (TVP38/TMEM64 family)
MHARLLGCALLVLAALTLWFALDLGRYASLDGLRHLRAELALWHDAQPLGLALAYLGVYIVLLGLTLPVATAMSLAAGALFGFWSGLALASFGFSLGALLSFLAARHLLRESLRRRWAARLAVVDRNIAAEGVWYLFSLRLLPLVPPMLINPVMGVTAMKTGTFYAVTQAGSLLGTAIYVNAGTQLARLQTLQDVWSPAVIASVVLLLVFALATRGLLVLARRRGKPQALVRHEP